MLRDKRVASGDKLPKEGGKKLKKGKALGSFVDADRFVGNCRRALLTAPNGYARENEGCEWVVGGGGVGRN